MSDTATRPPATKNSLARHPSSAPTWRSLLRWESALVLVLIGVLIFGSSESSTFLNSTTFFFTGLNMGEVAIMALPLLLIVMIGEIDLSVASMLGLSGAVMGHLFQSGWSIWAAMAAALVVGAVGGALNGVLVAKAGLPSIAVTIGTLTLFRGVAEIVLPTPTNRLIPLSLSKIGVVPIQGTEIAYSAAIFVVLALVCAIVLHATSLGRSIIAIGMQPEAALFSGIRVTRIRFGLYVASGIICAFAGILFTLKNSSASYGAGSGLELTVVAIVLFGGVSIFGGRGTVLGVALSVAIVGCLQQALTQMHVQPEVQNIVTGLLLLISVIVPNSGAAVRRIRERTRR
ncbi:MAG: ABC transporter permease [Actinomycetota bacterium]|nr:ABC transporter permease [Actinomycetota bacterium]MDQ2957995.1 ABC transporter permease [Actinomycetota bacterium]